MAKRYVDINVYTAAQQRLEYIFNEFDNVLVAYSGGKDSGVCLNLCYDYAKEHSMLDKLAMYHLDYEAQYQMTTDYVTETFEQFSDIKRYWLCLPVGADCGCRMDAGTWIPWEKSKEDIWVRKMPDVEYLIDENNCPFQMYPGQQDYEVQDNFSKWYSSEFGNTAIVIGIRADESLNRYRAIVSDRKVNGYKDKNYIVSQNKSTHNAYIIYDWTVSDIWTYNSKFNKKYNKLYDLYYQAGLKVDQMRVANPFHSCGEDNLRLYKVIDPNNWGKLVGRVNGVNFTSIYGGTTAMGWKNIKKPSHFSWKEYCYFLLNTLDDKTKKHYLEKLETSIAFWRDKGGALSEDTIKELNGRGTIGAPGKQSVKRTVKFEEYPDDLEEVTNFKEVPTYKRMCVCIIKNDYYCKYMGFAQTKYELKKRREAIEKYAKL